MNSRFKTMQPKQDYEDEILTSIQNRH